MQIPNISKLDVYFDGWPQSSNRLAENIVEAKRKPARAWLNYAGDYKYSKPVPWTIDDYVEQLRQFELTCGVQAMPALSYLPGRESISSWYNPEFWGVLADWLQVLGQAGYDEVMIDLERYGKTKGQPSYESFGMADLFPVGEVAAVCSRYGIRLRILQANAMATHFAALHAAKVDLIALDKLSDRRFEPSNVGYRGESADLLLDALDPTRVPVYWHSALLNGAKPRAGSLMYFSSGSAHDRKLGEFPLDSWWDRGPDA